MRKLLNLYAASVLFVNAGNAFAFLFQIVLARSLTLDEMGAFNALFSLINTSLAPASVVLFILVRLVSMAELQSPGAVKAVMQKSVARAALVAAGVLAAGFVLAGPLASLLRIDSVFSVWLAFVALALGQFYFITVAWQQGLRRHISAGLTMGGLSVLRVLVALAVILVAPLSLSGALISTGLPFLLLFIVGAACLTDIWRAPAAPPRAEMRRDAWRFAFNASVTTLIMFALWNLDVVLVRIHFSAEQSGLYALAAVLGRAPMLIGGALVNVFFPEAVREFLEREEGRPPAAETGQISHLRLSLVAASALGLGAALGIAVLAHPVLLFLAGETYVAAAPILRVVAVAMAALAPVQIVVTYMLAHHRYEALAPLVVAIATFWALASFVAATPLQVAICLASVIAGLLAVCLLLLWRVVRAPARA